MKLGQAGKSHFKNAQGSRIVLYSHDSMGLGHMRRNLLIARSLIESDPNPNILIVAGAHVAANFATSYGIDALTLPALHKIGNGNYRSRSLDLGINELIELRKQTINAAIEVFEPDILVVDNVPRGVFRELDLTLSSLKRKGKTRCVLGLRDILDEPETIRAEWSKADNLTAIREYYDQVWVYGDPSFHDLSSVHKFPADVAAKIRFTGYFDQRKRLEWSTNDTLATNTPLSTVIRHGERLALCVVGGGEDGQLLAETFARAELPDDSYGLIVTGPYMSKPAFQRLRNISAGRRIDVIKQFHEPTQLLSIADRVVSMGGYNTVNEVLSFDKSMLVVPRVVPRQEQLIRARRLQELGLVDYVHPDEASPDVVTNWLNFSPVTRPSARTLLDFNGLDRVSAFVSELAGDSKRAPYDQGCDGRNGGLSQHVA